MDNEAKIVAQLEMLNKQIDTMNVTMHEMVQDMKKIAVLEERHTSSAAAIERAFASIKKTEDALALAMEMNAKAHKGYDRWINIMTGVIFAVSILWTVFGVFISDTVRENIRAVTKMEMHMRDAGK